MEKYKILHWFTEELSSTLEPAYTLKQIVGSSLVKVGEPLLPSIASYLMQKSFDAYMNDHDEIGQTNVKVGWSLLLAAITTGRKIDDNIPTTFEEWKKWLADNYSK